MSFDYPVPGSKWTPIPPSEATEETPPWMIAMPKGKQLRWKWRGKERIIREGLYLAFDSFAELAALVDFLHGHPDFVLTYGRHQVILKPEHLTEMPDHAVRFTFDDLPGEAHASHVHKDVRKLTALWISQLPWHPVPVPYRWWAPGSARKATPHLPFSRTDPDYARQVIKQLVPDAELRKRVLELLADLVVAASAATQSWRVILHAGEVILSVGIFRCFHLNPTGITVWWKGESIGPPAVRAQAREGSAPVPAALEWIPDVQPRMVELIQSIATETSTWRLESQKSHSPGVLHYIEQELGDLALQR